MAKNKPADEQGLSVSVVIPVKNESGNIESAVSRMPSLGRSTEIIFIEGNSTDDTWEKIKETAEEYKQTHRIVFARQKGHGKADAVREGFEMATGEILMILDGDLTISPKNLTRFYDAIASGKGRLVVGSRFAYPMQKGAMKFLNRLGNRFFSSIFSWLFRQPIQDALCGVKVLFHSDYLKFENKNRVGRLDPFGDFDLFFAAYKFNLKIIQVPVYYEMRSYGCSSLPRFKHGLLLLKLCLLQLKDRLLA